MTQGSVGARADALIDLGRATEAITMLSSALAADPDSAMLQSRLSRAYLAAKQPELALQAANRAIALAPEEEWGHRLQSHAYSELRRHVDAARSASEAVRQAPHEWRTHARFAIASAQANHVTHAKDAAARAVQLAPDVAESHFAVGFAASQAGDTATAETAYRRVLAIQPNHATAMNNLSLLAMRKGGLNKALRGFGAALAVDAQLSVAQRNLRVVASRYARRFHFAVVIIYFILATSFNKPGSGGFFEASNQVSNSSRLHAAIVGVALLLVLVAALVIFDRRLPSNLRRYYRRLPFTDLYLGAWLAVDVAALVLMACIAIPTTYSGRSQLVGIAWALIIVGLLVSWGPRFTRRYWQQRGRR